MGLIADALTAPCETVAVTAIADDGVRDINPMEMGTRVSMNDRFM
jgi:hypothetical protein